MKVSDERLRDICRALSGALKSGLALGRAFEILSRSPGHGKLIAGAAGLTARGLPIHEALKAQKIFPPALIALIRAGEQSGKTAEFLDLFADWLEIRIEFRRRLERALIYPVFAAIAAAALVAFVSAKAVPAILGPLMSAGMAPPDQVLRLNALAARAYQYWPQMFISLCALWLALKIFLSSGLGRGTLSLAGHLLPGFRYAAEEAWHYYFYATMGMLLRAGLAPGAMTDAFLYLSEDDFIARRRFARAAEMLAAGKSFSESLAGCLPAEDRQSIELAESAGRLDEALPRLAANHRDAHLHRLKSLAVLFRLAATAAVVLLCFGALWAVARPFLYSLNNVTGLFSDLQPAAPGRVPPPARVSGSGAAQGGLPLPDSYIIRDPTALFNTGQGKKIAGLMSGRAEKGDKPQPAPADKAASQSRPAARPSPKPENPPAKKTLSPAPPIKTLRFQRISPTEIK